MGNSNSTQNENGGGNSNGGVGESNMIIDLDGKYHIDYKNRNYKKLKTSMFSTYFENFEIVPSDTLVNSDYVKNKPTKKQQQSQQSQQQPVQTIPSSTTIVITPPQPSNILAESSYPVQESELEQKERLELEEKENQEINNNQFLKSSPVPTPPSSVSINQLNPDLSLDSVFEQVKDDEPIQPKEELQSQPQQQPIQPKEVVINQKSSSTTNLTPIITQAALLSNQNRSSSIPSFNRKNVKDNKKNKKDTSAAATTSTPTTTTTTTTKPNRLSTMIIKDGASILTDKPEIKIYSVDLSINRIEFIPNDILSIMAKFEIQELSLCTNFFQIIPDLQIVKSLTTINLTRNKLSKLQTSVFIELPSLTSLVLDRNFITTIPDDIDQIKSLKNLSIRHNALESLPNSFSNLYNLISLDLSQNKIKALPPQFEDLVNLQMVWLSYNQITSLPPMKKLVNLSLFDISSNRLTSIPKDFAYLVPPRIKKQKQNRNGNNSNNGNRNSSIGDNGLFGNSSTTTTTTTTTSTLSSTTTCNNSNNELLMIQDNDYDYQDELNINSNDNNIIEMINTTDLEGGGLGCLRELNIRDNREIVTLPVEYKQVESLMTIITSIPSEIIPGLFLGGLDSANNAPILQMLGITHILLAIGDCEPFFPKTFRYYAIDDARDTPQYDISQHFEQTNCFIEAGRKAGGVLVHCRAGISRSSTLILSYLMKYNRLTLKQAMEMVALKRPQIQPNPGFKDQLLKYEAKLFCNNILKRTTVIYNNNNNNINGNNNILSIGSSTSTTPNLSSTSSSSETISPPISKLSISK